MRIFNISRRMTAQGEVLESINLNLSVADVKVIIAGLEKFKTDDVLFASAKTDIVSQLKKICHE